MFRLAIRRHRLTAAAAAAAIGLALVAAPAAATSAAASPHARPQRAQGPCDIYAAGGTPCVAAHSTTRALYADYNGPLYQVQRLSDGHTRDIGVIRHGRDGAGYADSAAQDRFCANTTCLVTKIYDQSPEHNDLTQAPRGAFSGPALGGQNNLPIADMAPITIAGHKAYGVFIEPGMGLRNNDTRGIAVDDQPEGMYWVVDGQHYNDGCCFDYGNTEIDSHDDGNGTMETSYFGNAPYWYYGRPPGPWVMTDQENNLVGCVNPGSTSKYCPNLPTMTSRFVTAVAKGEPHHWASLGGDSQQGALQTMYDGPRVDSSYDPMRKQGGIVLGNGGDNSNGSQGTFYEGVMTRGYPSTATDQAVQANIVAAAYNVQGLSLAPADQTATPPGLQTFAPGTSQQVTEKFTNTTGATANRVRLSLAVPGGWRAVVAGGRGSSTTFDSVAPGDSVSATFTVTSGRRDFNGDLVGRADWSSPDNSRARGRADWNDFGHGPHQHLTTTERVRNTDAIKINEFRVATTGNPTNSFIELYNSSNSSVNISNWTLTEHATQQPVNSTITIPAGTTLGAGKTYLLGLSASGLATPANAGDSSIYLRSTTGLKAGDQVQIGTGRDAETRTIAAVNNSGATGPRVPGKIGNAVKLSGNGEYIELPTGIVSGLHDFTVAGWVNLAATGQTWARIFDFGTGTNDFMFLTAAAGGTNALRFDINSGNGSQMIPASGSGPTLPTGWQHVAITLSGTTGTMWLNGQPVATNSNMTITPADLGITNQNWIGRSQFSADPYLNATVDDFQIYDRALSASEMAALASGQPGAGDVASYKFDEAGGPIAYDSSGHGRNATIISPGTVSTPLWQPLPDGPITVPAGSTNVPVTSTAGFTVGQKMAIGYGTHIETVTVTAVGTPGTQAALAAPAPAGTNNLKVTSTANIRVGDSIRLDIGSRIERVTVTAVGTPGPDGTGLTLAAPLKFTHSANLPFSDRGTGISFTPATRYAHSSDEPVQALSGITLSSPLSRSHWTDSAVVDSAVTNAGYQGPPTPDLWFGGPALSASAGSMVLRDARGMVADSLNYGALVDPPYQEGYQGASGSGRQGCFAPTPGTAAAPGMSTARYPDGNDTDTNCADFYVTRHPTPGASNQAALDAGPRVSLEATAPGSSSQYVRHDDVDDGVVMSTVTASSSTTVKQDATFVEAAGLANPSCVSFESVNRPGSYLRHQNFILHLQPNDGGPLFASDATFCPKPGNSGSGTSFQSFNFPTKYIRAYQGGVYVAGNGGTNPWDDTNGWAVDSSWNVAAPWAPAS